MGVKAEIADLRILVADDGTYEGKCPCGVLIGPFPNAVSVSRALLQHLFADKLPEAGMPITYDSGTDSYVYTIDRISPSGKTIYFGDGKRAWQRPNGYWRAVGGNRVHIGHGYAHRILDN